MTDRTYVELIRTRGEITDYQLVELAVDGRIATITMNDPETLNAFSPRMTGELNHALKAAEGNENVRAVILTGKGRAFTAGGDLRMMGAGDLGPIEQHEFVRQEFGGVVQQIVGMSKPVIAAVNGFAFFKKHDIFIHIITHTLRGFNCFSITSNKGIN